MTNVTWYKAKVVVGAQNGRQIGFPTVNLDPHILPSLMRQGIYSSTVIYKDKTYQGALYFGPRTLHKETVPILEIHILDFNKNIYGEEVTFSINSFIREIKSFSSMDELKKQIHKDIDDIKNKL
ncbi:hypothetical protein A2334_01180 [Candidatus Roizmanbacteria bacterium RIFOXYB2_FULL_38_10]|uniref:riboflavin kinase n=1 Tax=Candidatus Roizmanbacteria bacterium RIFOXYD1_FULL_38_12 TaxID=1802093 RepID=A0A1F7L1L5_9BACT|nr:MAG: hypothetical protein A3K47_04475 [Candidatus Roizmanbacteria bacterium RIFOXYA2_FULL_38_14]OGK64008.1 MAG: hypothetical protein A3K27_04475 [Candidatus Roizmanbacteria bacterium RIFOXYA1_FULL_37_12]OGK65854.1 MAG: hypothetical protein A3K38_04475 [Candidatus Roizmanbacteria bacterium RIFOXYB1_FULL_40_23]OGK68961.1 MAG: hypothetical protein A2334_01180 [Candidatus Roizmanbacteria bacterium RIFOXYB2_FULL_38_10]OGK70259.1 MAG: hypothetical protein A3K21_04480 [Candidatus Roizmanbacteria ba